MPFRFLRTVAQRALGRLDIVAVAVMACLIGYQLFVPPVIGLADNGDFERLMGPLGLYHLSDNYDDRYFRYVNPAFRVGDPWWPSGVVSSQLLTLRAAMLANGRVSRDGLLDIRAIGAANLFLFLAAAWVVLLAGRTLPIGLRLPLAGLVVAIFTDVGYVSYFNSIYSEPASLTYLLLVVGASLHVILTPRPKGWWMTLYFTSAVLLVLAKAQNVPLGWLLVFWSLLLFRGWTGRRWRRATAAGMAVLVLGTASAYYFATPLHIREATLYNTVFYGVLRVSPSPQEDLRSLGLDPGLAKYANTTFYDPGIPRDDPLFKKALFPHLTQSRVVAFYAGHPDRLLTLLSRGARRATQIHVRGLGNFTAASGRPPWAQSQAFVQWSRLRAQWPRTPWFLAGLFLAGLIAAAGLWIRARTLAHRQLAALCLLLVLMAAVQYLVKFLGNGLLDGVKQLYLFNVLIDLCLIAGALRVVHALALRFPGARRPAPQRLYTRGRMTL